jgi:arginyl-tRNA synthetase
LLLDYLQIFATAFNGVNCSKTLYVLQNILIKTVIFQISIYTLIEKKKFYGLKKILKSTKIAVELHSMNPLLVHDFESEAIYI